MIELFFLPIQPFILFPWLAFVPAVLIRKNKEY